MGKSSSAKRRQFWRTDWFVAVLIVMAVVVLHQATDLIGTVERRFYDFASTSSGRQPSDRIAVIAIDDQSIANIVRKDIPERLANIVALSLSKRSETRYQDGDQFAADLRSVLAEMSGAPAASVAPAVRADSADSDKTVVLARQGAGPAFEATVLGMAVPPGYDATQKTDAGDREAFARTAVISRSGATGSPAAGADKTDPEAWPRNL